MIEAFGDWFVAHNTLLSGIAAFLGILSVVFIAIRQAFGAVFRPLEWMRGVKRPLKSPPVPPVGTLIDAKPAIAVLPFRTISKGEDESYLADGIAEDIVVNLSYCRLIPVISSATSFRYRDSDLSLQEIGKEIGARYLVRGTVRRSADQFLITVELDDTQREEQIWSERYKRDPGDLFKLQEEIADTLVGKIDPALRAAEMSRARRTPAGNAQAYDHLLRGLWHHNKFRPDEHKAAVKQFSAAIKSDPEYAFAHAMLATAHYTSAYLSWTEDPATEFQAAATSARTAIELDPGLAEGFVVLTYSALIMRDFPTAEHMAGRAVHLNPCSAQNWFASGLVHLYRGKFETALENFHRSIRLNAHDPMIWIVYLAMTIADYCLEDYEGSVAYTEKARIADHKSWPGKVIGCAALLRLGREEEARAIIEEGGEDLASQWSIGLSRMPFEDPKWLSKIAEPIHAFDDRFLFEYVEQEVAEDTVDAVSGTSDERNDK